MHLASLYHDDVMDEAVIRRGVESVNARYGNLVAIVAGDYLMARSAGLAADLGADAASLMASTLAWLTRGQVSEVRTLFSLERTENDYFERHRGKDRNPDVVELSHGRDDGAVLASRRRRR